MNKKNKKQKIRSLIELLDEPPSIIEGIGMASTEDNVEILDKRHLRELYNKQNENVNSCIICLSDKQQGLFVGNSFKELYSPCKCVYYIHSNCFDMYIKRFGRNCMVCKKSYDNDEDERIKIEETLKKLYEAQRNFELNPEDFINLFNDDNAIDNYFHIRNIYNTTSSGEAYSTVSTADKTTKSSNIIALSSEESSIENSNIRRSHLDSIEDSTGENNEEYNTQNLKYLQRRIEELQEALAKAQNENNNRIVEIQSIIESTSLTPEELAVYNEDLEQCIENHNEMRITMEDVINTRTQIKKFRCTIKKFKLQTILIAVSLILLVLIMLGV